MGTEQYPSYRRISQRRLLFSLLFGLVVALASAANDMQHILVTGGNSGIGLALCKRLVTERGCYVYLGSRSAERGAAALKTITDAFPDTASKLEMVQLDVTDDKSVAAAAQALKAKGVTLYALVNNGAWALRMGIAAAPKQSSTPTTSDRSASLKPWLISSTQRSADRACELRR